jgi:ABC-type polysaccharide/polyol phosphate transport system ATPase subunit
VTIGYGEAPRIDSDNAVVRSHVAVPTGHGAKAKQAAARANAANMLANAQAQATAEALAESGFKVIIENVTLDLDRNSKFGLVGKNGCGKVIQLKVVY